MKYRIKWKTVAHHEMTIDAADLRQDEDPEDWFARLVESDAMYEVDHRNDADRKEFTLLDWRWV